MSKFATSLASGIGLLFLGSLAPPPPQLSYKLTDPRVGYAVASPLPQAPALTPGTAAPAPPEPAQPEPEPPPTPQEALAEGVLIVVSLPSQKMFVFRDGEEWDSTRVSTGKRGKETPTGTFPILQKKVHHRSTLYDDAPMPYMQRLTWDGIALHAGRVPGYPASHGCVRLPRRFAEKLYRITSSSNTIVMVTDEPLGSAEEARATV